MKTRLVIPVSMIIGFMSTSFTIQHASAHEVSSGVSGCPVGACGITDWHMVETVSNTMFGVSLVTYIEILILFSYFLHRRRIILRVAENED